MQRRRPLLLMTMLLVMTALLAEGRQAAPPASAQAPPSATPAPVARQWTRGPSTAAPPILAPIDLLARDTTAASGAPATAPSAAPTGSRAWSGPLPAGGNGGPRVIPRDLPRNTCQDYYLSEGESASCTLNEGTWTWQVTITDTTCPGNISAVVFWPDGSQDQLTGFGSCGGTQSTPPHPLATKCCGEGNTGTLTIQYTDPGANPPPQNSVWTITFVEGDLLTPQITTINPQEGQQFTQVIANFTNTSPFQPVTPGSDFLASIDWGDGSPIENNMPVGGGAGGPYTVQGTHKYTDEGPEPNGSGGGGGNYLVHVTISDPG
ncbi:MAG TPA: hypothetical protein VND24_05470, partial [Steroidobacteraceae bacterium]|nr:hypothetical protein [Steroidobacteraceae bacterium]